MQWPESRKWSADRHDGRERALGGKGPIVRTMLKRWGVDPGECVTVGDSNADIPAFQEVAHAIAVRPSTYQVSEAAQLTLPDLHGYPQFTQY